MRSLHLSWVAAACLLAAAAALLLVGRGSAAVNTAPWLRLPTALKRSAPTLRPITSSNTVSTVQRTFVSTSGSDSNACTATAPCRSFATALTKTTAGGEVVALTSGGYGPVGLGMAVTLVASPGVDAAITATSGDAIDVAAGSTDTVVLRNLDLSGLGAGLAGIDYTSGEALHLDNITATGFANYGVLDANPTGQLYATNVEADNNTYGIIVSPGSGTTQADLDDVRTDGNSQAGIFVAHANARVSNCISSGNAFGVEAESPTMISGCQLSDNNTDGLVELGATVQIGGSSVTHNATGLVNSSGTLQSFGDNLLAANTTDTTGTITTIGKS